MLLHGEQFQKLLRCSKFTRFDGAMISRMHRCVNHVSVCEGRAFLKLKKTRPSQVRVLSRNTSLWGTP